MMTRKLAIWILCFFVVLAVAENVRADGGVVRGSQIVGKYRVTVFTSPTPLRAGPADVSVYVQDAASGQHVPEAMVSVSIAPTGRPNAAVSYPATIDAATNKLFPMAMVEIPSAGAWELTANVSHAGEEATLRCEVDAAEPLPRGVEMAPWIALPLLPIVLFVLRERQHERRCRGPRPR